MWIQLSALITMKILKQIQITYTFSSNQKPQERFDFCPQCHKLKRKLRYTRSISARVSIEPTQWDFFVLKSRWLERTCTKHSFCLVRTLCYELADIEAHINNTSSWVLRDDSPVRRLMHRHIASTTTTF